MKRAIGSIILALLTIAGTRHSRAESRPASYLTNMRAPLDAVAATGFPSEPPGTIRCGGVIGLYRMCLMTGASDSVSQVWVDDHWIRTSDWKAIKQRQDSQTDDELDDANLKACATLRQTRPSDMGMFPICH